ncbi:MAG: hypothetical protein UZ21_OP11001001115 [Microgenomates bacterium OLB22]|nr:MAG: hypothetical protein UZ21_OP11001001115 [Microgenomates bacterium OLB22]
MDQDRRSENEATKIPLRERLASRDTRYAVARLLGVQDIRELQNTSEITLNRGAHDVIVSSVTDTQSTVELREKLVELDLDENGQLLIRRDIVGTAFDVKRLSGEVNPTILQHLLHTYTRILLPIARPIPMHMHTHPTVTPAHYPDFRLRIKHADKEILVEGDEAFSYLGAFTREFSESDLLTYYGNRRYVRTAVMASTGGIRLLYNPDFGILSPPRLIGKPACIKAYRREKTKK